MEVPSGFADTTCANGTDICPAWRGRVRSRGLWRTVNLKLQASLKGVLEPLLDERNGEVRDVDTHPLAV